MQWDHPALKPHYRGWDGATADHNYNWFNPEPFAPCADPTIPCDSNSCGHGTHVTGITAGDDGAGNQIGVAPGAQWIHALGCCPSDAALLKALQWMLAPTDLNGDNAELGSAAAGGEQLVGRPRRLPGVRERDRGARARRASCRSLPRATRARRAAAR